MSGLLRRVTLSLVIVVATSGCWAQYRGDAGHSGAQALEATIGRKTVSTLGEAWVSTTGAPVAAPAIVALGMAFVVATDGLLYAFDAGGVIGCSGHPKRCTPLWTAAAPDVLQGSPAVAGFTVYVQGSVAVYAFDPAGVSGCSGTPKTCSPLWSSSAIGHARSSPTVADGLLFTSGAHGLHAFDAAAVDGCSGSPKVCEPLWTSQEFSPTVDASPAVAHGLVYVGDGSTLYVYDAQGSAGCSGSPKARCAASLHCTLGWQSSRENGSAMCGSLLGSQAF